MRLKVVGCIVYEEDPMKKDYDNPQFKPNEHIVGILRVTPEKEIGTFHVFLLVEER